MTSIEANIEKPDNSEAEAESEQNFMSTNMFLKQAKTDFKPITIGLTLSILLAIALFYKVKQIQHKYKVLLSLGPFILSIIYFYYKNMTKPRAPYLLSLFFGPKSMQTNFKHKTKMGWPFPGSAIIRIDNKPYLFVGGGDGQDDVLLLYDKEKNELNDFIGRTTLTNPSDTITTLSRKSATYSALSYDIDQDGVDDLVVGREDGVYLYVNKGGLEFKAYKIWSGSQDSVPLSIAVSDFNRDGKPDIYMSYFTKMDEYRGSVFNDPYNKKLEPEDLAELHKKGIKPHGRKNLLLQNISKDNINFTNVTDKVNAGGLNYNTFTSAFVDLNSDRWPDLVLAHDSGPVEILKNDGGKFISSIPYKPKGNWMGIAAGDIDNDGDQDLFLTNVGTLSKKYDLAYGDVTAEQREDDEFQTFDHALLLNKSADVDTGTRFSNKKDSLEKKTATDKEEDAHLAGENQFKFEEKSNEYGIDNSAFGWGAVFEDIDMDGYLDLLFAENTKLYPIQHVVRGPSHFYKGTGEKFKREFKYNNHGFGQTALAVDMDRDGKKDVVWINMEGPVTMYLNKNSANNYFVLELPQTGFANAKIVLDSGSKKFYKENIQGGTGFGSDTNDGRIMFGLHSIDTIKEVRVHTVNDEVFVLRNPKINSVVKLIKPE